MDSDNSVWPCLRGRTPAPKRFYVKRFGVSSARTLTSLFCSFAEPWGSRQPWECWLQPWEHVYCRPAPHPVASGEGLAEVVLVVAVGSVGDEGGGRRSGCGVHTMNLLNIVLSALGTCSGLTNWQGRLLIGECRVRLAFSWLPLFTHRFLNLACFFFIGSSSRVGPNADLIMTCCCKDYPISGQFVKLYGFLKLKAHCWTFVHMKRVCVKSLKRKAPFALGNMLSWNIVCLSVCLCSHFVDALVLL